MPLVRYPPVPPVGKVRLSDELNKRRSLRASIDRLWDQPTGQFPPRSGPTLAKPSGEYTPLGGFVLLHKTGYEEMIAK